MPIVGLVCACLPYPTKLDPINMMLPKWGLHVSTTVHKYSIILPEWAGCFVMGTLTGIKTSLSFGYLRYYLRLFDATYCSGTEIIIYSVLFQKFK